MRKIIVHQLGMHTHMHSTYYLMWIWARRILPEQKRGKVHEQAKEQKTRARKLDEFISHGSNYGKDLRRIPIQMHKSSLSRAPEQKINSC